MPTSIAPRSASGLLTTSLRRLGSLISALAACAVLLATNAGAQQDERRWQPLKKDGLHDPANRMINMLQEPSQAMSRLAPDVVGNQVRWVESLAKGEIKPRAAIQPSTQIRTRDSVLLLNLKGGTPMVRFPHWEHTQWLDCSNCHDALFKTEIGKTKIDMRSILRGEQCGVCHGAVAFPLTECARCHNTPRKPGVRHDGTAMILTPATTKD